MAYKITYGPEDVFSHAGKQRNHGWLPAAALLLALAALALAALHGSLTEWLLPGDPVVTEAALQTLARQISAGAPVGDAVRAFCLEILENAGIPQ